MNIAVVSETKDRARALAHELGVTADFVFGQRGRLYFEGLRADLVLIDATARIPREFVSVIIGNVRKTPGGRVRYVRVSEVLR
mgnify:CR=1 FL=1